MAEIVGAVASGIALAEVLGKAGGTILKLKQLSGEVNDVPETIEYLMGQIECLDPTIWEAKPHFAHNELPPLRWNSTAARRSAECCRNALQKLSGLVDDLSGQINSTKRFNRKLAFVKVVLKRDDLRRLERRLETAMRVLQSAQMAYQSVQQDHFMQVTH